MKILYDHQIFSMQKFGGISRYFIELIKEFRKHNEINVFTSLTISENYYASDLKMKFIHIDGSSTVKGLRILCRKLNQFVTYFKILFRKYDIIHPTYFEIYFRSALRNRPYVITVYDMIHEK